MRSRSRTDAADERGFTVVEVIITVALIAVVSIPLLNTLVRANETARYSYDRNDSIDSLRLVANDMAKDLRQSSAATAISTSSITVSTYVDTTAATVTWRAVTSGSDTQVERVVDGGTPRVYVVDLAAKSDGTGATTIFSYDGVSAAEDVRRVTVALATQPDVRHPVLEISTEVELRNAN